MQQAFGRLKEAYWRLCLITCEGTGIRGWVCGVTPSCGAGEIQNSRGRCVHLSGEVCGEEGNGPGYPPEAGFAAGVSSADLA